jgi:hypothetical protein
LELIGAHQLLVYADDINVLFESINNIKKETVALLQATREISVHVNTEKTTYMVMSCHQKVGQNKNLLIANKSFGNVA